MQVTLLTEKIQSTAITDSELGSALRKHGILGNRQCNYVMYVWVNNQHPVMSSNVHPSDPDPRQTVPLNGSQIRSGIWSYEERGPSECAEKLSLFVTLTSSRITWSSVK